MDVLVSQVSVGCMIPLIRRSFFALFLQMGYKQGIATGHWWDKSAGNWVGNGLHALE